MMRLLTTALFLTLALTACSSQHVDDLAVGKMSLSEIQAAGFLPLNADKPGTPVDVQRYLVPGKYTIVAYLSPYSNDCVNVAQGLAQLPQVRPDLAVRTIDINRPGLQDIDWQSPIIAMERIGSLPYIRIYDPRQTLRAQGRPAFEQVAQWINYRPYPNQ
jgi:hypothetical protein